MNRKYDGKIFKIISSTGDFYIGYCYQKKLETYFEIIKKNYLLWKNNLKNKGKYCVLFGFFEKFGIDCNIILITIISKVFS